ncbi:MAG: serine/threonine protein kinase [Gemmataceae bacterium]|nr:serine/threonine protein kinase [Gemmataceae bacterium]
MEPTVESLCNQLARNRLLEPEVIRNLRQRWRTEFPDSADDVGRFSKWIVAGGHLTDFQYGLLTRGFADMLWLDEYKLLDRIGKGRMAGVYKGVHRLGQVVAVKVLPPSKARSEQLLARFQREARLAVRLKHPNVVRTFQMGETHGELHYIVMEYLDGETLEDVLERRRRLPVNEAVHVLLQALRGLQHIDDEGLVHRDLKPANLMLVPGRVKDQPDTTLKSVVKILDIGLGRALFDEGGPGVLEGMDLTSEGALLGTPNYMAPEQARNAHTADIRSDLYSLGCVFYHMLTGQPPFPDMNLVRQLMRHLQEPPRPLRELNPDVPQEWQAVMDRFLAKDPALRFATAGEAFKAVKALAPQLADAPAAPEPGPQLRSFLTWLDTNPYGEEAPATVSPAPAKTLGPMPVPVSVAAPATAPVPWPVPVSVVPPPAARPLLPPTRRDLLFAGMGAGVLLVVGLVIWGVVRLL